jgi:hypothetical protein
MKRNVLKRFVFFASVFCTSNTVLCGEFLKEQVNKQSQKSDSTEVNETISKMQSWHVRKKDFIKILQAEKYFIDTFNEDKKDIVSKDTEYSELVLTVMLNDGLTRKVIVKIKDS